MVAERRMPKNFPYKHKSPALVGDEQRMLDNVRDTEYHMLLSLGMVWPAMKMQLGKLD